MKVQPIKFLVRDGGFLGLLVFISLIIIYGNENLNAKPREVAKLQANDEEAGDRFGHSVSISGERAIVGARWENTDTGAAYIFERDASGTWSEVAKVLSRDEEAWNFFGHSVSISGEWVIVGAYVENATGVSYIFERDASGTWSEVAKVQASDIEEWDFFGHSVSISGEWAIVGAPFEDIGGDDAGAAYIFKRDGSGTWSEVAKVQASDKEWAYQFGYSVSISGEQVIVGAPFERTGGNMAGAVYIFECDAGGTWSEVAKVQASDKEHYPYQCFGGSVSISGERAIIGAGGAAYIFERDGSGTWSEVAKVQASDNEPAFGVVSISGTRAIVGAAGTAYIFERDASGTWSEVAKVQSSDIETGNCFGNSVSISGGRAIVGASCRYLAGSAYIYEFTPEEKIDTLIEDVEKLLTTEVLTSGLFNSLTSKLESAKAKLDKGNTKAALNAIYAFIKQVNSLIADGVLTPAEGQLLIDAANAIIDNINAILPQKKSG